MALIAVSLPIPVNAQRASLVKTFVTKIDGQTMWVTVVRRGPNQPPQTAKTWWQWGNATSDEYLFAMGRPTHHVRLILEFSQLTGGRLRAKFFTNRLGKSPVRYSLSGGSLKILSEHGYPYVVMDTRRGGWLYDGRTNYDVTLRIDGFSGLGQQLYPDGRTSALIHVGQAVPGVPQWETERLLRDPHKSWGYTRFGADERLPSAPPYAVMQGLMPDFPYFNIGNGQFDWYQRNPSPLYYSLPASQLLINHFVGFENAGNYAINSLAQPPSVDFESPFGFYNFLPNSRHSQLVVRSESFPATDVLSPYAAAHRVMTSFRYSWAGSNPTLWDYSLQVAGSIPLSKTVRIGGQVVHTIPPRTLPKWVISQRWPMVSFVQAMNGYPGSEGIYEYTSQIPPAWPWLLGASAHPPSYWQFPYLSSKTGTATHKNAHPGETLAAGFRGEYNASDFRKPELYISPVDGLVHLAWATSGVWNLGNGWYVRTNSLAHGPYFDEWLLKHLAHPGRHPRAKGGTTVQTVYELGKYVIYSGAHRAIIRQLTHVPTPVLLSPPSSANSWKSFLSRTSNGVDGVAPRDLASWLHSLAGTSIKLPGASVTNAFYGHGKFHMTLTLRNPVHLGPVAGFPRHLRAGTYAIIYDSATKAWTVQRALLGHFDTRLSIGRPLLAQRGQVQVALKSRSNVMQRVRMVFRVGQRSRRTFSLMVPPGGRMTHTWNWIPRRTGRIAVSLMVNGKDVVDRRVMVRDPSRSVFLKESLPDSRDSLIAGLALLILTLIATGMWVAATDTDWRRRVGSSGKAGGR